MSSELSQHICPGGSSCRVMAVGSWTTHLKKMRKSTWIMKPKISRWKRNYINTVYLKPPPKQCTPEDRYFVWGVVRFGRSSSMLTSLGLFVISSGSPSFASPKLVEGKQKTLNRNLKLLGFHQKGAHPLKQKVCHVHTVDGSKIRRSPVDMVNITFLQGFIHPNGGCLGFLNHRQYDFPVETPHHHVHSDLLMAVPPGHDHSDSPSQQPRLRHGWNRKSCCSESVVGRMIW